MNYIKIEASSLSNGLGWRVVLWVSGCSHACLGCHNPETWCENAGKRFSEKEYDLIKKLLNKSYIKGITLSGGDPLFLSNRKSIEELVVTLKNEFPNKDIWCYTGYDFEEVKNLKVMQYIDVLVDGKFIEEQKDISLAFRGSKNQRIVDVKKSLDSGEVILYME